MNRYLTSTQEKYTGELSRNFPAVVKQNATPVLLSPELQVKVAALLTHLLKAEIARLLASFPGLCKCRRGAGGPVRS